jgi:phage gp16-like protein
MHDRAAVVPARQVGKTLATAMEANTKAMRAKIHIARKELALAEDDYRAILQRAAGIESTADAGPSHLDAVLKELRRLGWKAKHRKGAARRPLSPHAQIRMIYAVWADMRPHLSDGSESALRAFCARQTKTEANPAGVTAPEFLDAPMANRVLEGLKAWRARLRKAPKQGEPA